MPSQRGLSLTATGNELLLGEGGMGRAELGRERGRAREGPVASTARS